MTTIFITTNDQILSATILPRVASGNQNTVRIHVDFDEHWDGYKKSAIFRTSKNPTPYEKILSSDGNCLVPPEVLIEAGHLFISVKGVKPTNVLTGELVEIDDSLDDIIEKQNELLGNNSANTDSSEIAYEIKTSEEIRYKISAGTPSVVISDPTDDVYHQLLDAYGNTTEALAVERARINNLVNNGTGDLTNNAELQDIRIDFEGKTHSSAGEAVRVHEKKLTRGRFSMAILLPSSQGVYPSISTVDRTFKMGADTLIISDRLPGGWVSLYPQEDNGHVTWSSELNTSAICFYYDISTNKLVAKQYNDFTIDNNYILIATLRAHGSGAWAVCSCPIYVDGKLSTEVNTIGGFTALLPPLDANNNEQYPKISTTDKTFITPYDTLIVDPRLPNNYVSLRAESGNNTVYFGDYTTSAICIYYDISMNTLIAKPYNESVNTRFYLLICTIRTREPKQYTMAYASCPVWIDDRLSTERERVINTSANAIVKSVNHRGYCTEAPENTLSAFRLSKKKGFAYVECDVSFTSDGIPVLLHDATIDRTSNGSGNINALTLDEVKALDFGSWKSEKYTGEQIPTFEEFITLCRSLDLCPYVELKTGTEEQIKTLVDTVKRCGMKDKATWISFDAQALAYIKDYDRKARLGYIVGEITETAVDITTSLKTDYNSVFIDGGYDNLTADKISICSNADIPLEVWTVNDASAIISLDPYVSGVTSDNLIAGDVLINNSLN